MGAYPANGEYVGTVLETRRPHESTPLIPALLYNDGPQGFRDDANPGTSTAMPSGLNVAATWSKEAATTWGNVLGSEFFGKVSSEQEGERRANERLFTRTLTSKPFTLTLAPLCPDATSHTSILRAPT